MQSIAPAPIPQMHQEMSADNDLRAQLAAAINPPQHLPLPHAHQHPSSHGYSDPRASSSASPHDHNIDPAIHHQGAGGGMMSAGVAGDSGGDDNDGRKGGKRELSQSKRAAQNRAAQRAFRQRKEGYIKKLEEQVREFHQLEDQFKSVQAENYSLREYIIHLQSRLIATEGDLPPPPPNINLGQHPGSVQIPRPSEQQQHQQQQQHNVGSSSAASSSLAPLTQLQASAARGLAQAGLQVKHGQDDPYEQSKRYKGSEEGAADEDIIRAQLQGGQSHQL